MRCSNTFPLLGHRLFYDTVPSIWGVTANHHFLLAHWALFGSTGPGGTSTDVDPPRWSSSGSTNLREHSVSLGVLYMNRLLKQEVFDGLFDGLWMVDRQSGGGLFGMPKRSTGSHHLVGALAAI